MQAENTSSINLSKDLKIYISIIKDSWMYQIAIFITFTVCLSVFPAVTDLIQPIQKGKLALNAIYTNIVLLFY